jgi:peptidoglycan hydrolase-like protein with peptidoglycan-binding domain
VEIVRTRGVLGVALAFWAAAAAGPARAGPQQAGVQVALRALGLYSGPIDGVVGPQTVSAVRTAQVRFRLPVTGAIDARTRRALGPLGRPLLGDRTIRPGDFGLDVSVLQFQLSERGLYRGALDGFLGSRTDAAVRRFQRTAGLAVDGIVGPQTARALLRPHPGVGLPAPGDEATRTDVRDRLDDWAAQLGVSTHLVRALAWMESGYQPLVVSPVGAIGVLQTLPSTRDFVEDVLVGHAVPTTLDGDIEVGVLYLRHLLQRFDGDERLALGAWYEGERAVRQVGLYPETTLFVDDVLALRDRM